MKQYFVLWQSPLYWRIARNEYNVKQIKTIGNNVPNPGRKTTAAVYLFIPVGRVLLPCRGVVVGYINRKVVNDRKRRLISSTRLHYTKYNVMDNHSTQTRLVVPVHTRYATCIIYYIITYHTVTTSRHCAADNGDKMRFRRIQLI